ncbi:methyltransferase domain-containing protein [Roseofilum reptotaenium CS-1145]|uniref:Methyltransferase n=1 Tax=Roseofilum reptotaenium AO1-A TaxID=1925591 RepID=A0A1L9QNY1_9CYAN|nr:methyltransferase domain-containing protein [Roseofilum reptotaenium]MDB9517418.1 methyltransferase domain-containing protein [Roseofilum reptotaenium CS-1145]OJJ24380.1 methyltransferase [Roseofilum reptotaenium AO1-A]
MDPYKQEVADLFDRRKNYDSEDKLVPQLARRLIEQAGIQRGQKVLDLATGTGLVAIAAAQLVGPEGRVVGVDISPGMLNQAKSKIAAAGLSNIEMAIADVELVEFADNSFDCILCASSLHYLTDVPAALRRWYNFLMPDGMMGLCVFAETACAPGIVVRKVAERYGVVLPSWHGLTGTEDKCCTLLQGAGFEKVEVKTEQLGSYLSLSDGKRRWEEVYMKNPLCRLLQQLDSEKLAQAKAEYYTELEALVTDQGIWNDNLTFFAFGRK